MAATTSIRWAVARRILDLLSGHPNLLDVTVRPSFPGDNTGPLAVWIGDIVGEIDIPVMTAGRKIRDDIFEVKVVVRAQGQPDVDTACEAVEALVEAVEDVLADAPSLDDFDGVIDATNTGTREGPDRFDMGAAGWMAVSRTSIVVHSRLE